MIINLENLGTVNKNKVMLSSDNGNEIEVWFSYETPVSFHARIDGNFTKATRENDWSTTTGKLLNECESDKSKRISGDEFEKQLAEVLAVFK